MCERAAGIESPCGAEIAPEVIDAGVKLLLDYDPDFSNERDIVEKIMSLVCPPVPRNAGEIVP
jgi:hypothetical protein